MILIFYIKVTQYILIFLSLIPSIKADIISSTHFYNKDGLLRIKLPPHNLGDLLLLFLSRTDDVLPIKMTGTWKLVTSCLKPHNTKNSVYKLKMEIVEIHYMETFVMVVWI